MSLNQEKGTAILTKCLCKAICFSLSENLDTLILFVVLDCAQIVLSDLIISIE